MLVAIDKVGRAAEIFCEHSHLTRDLSIQRISLERAQTGAQQERAERQERAIASRAKTFAERAERCRQCYMQPDRHALRLGIERLQSERFAAMETRCHDHDRGGVEASAHDQIADRGIDRWRNAVIVRAEPDGGHSAAERADGSSAVRSLPSADLSSCSAT